MAGWYRVRSQGTVTEKALFEALNGVGEGRQTVLSANGTDQECCGKRYRRQAHQEEPPL